jgi:hypothetical protein
MDPGTARNHLITDLLFDFALRAGHKCHRCNQPLTRATFSVDHILPWLDSPNPMDLFFDLRNIAYSHLACNSRAGRRSDKQGKRISPEQVAAMTPQRQAALATSRAKWVRRKAKLAAERAAKAAA